MNPYKAVVAPNRIGSKDVVPASKYIGIHHCSIEFNSTALKPVIQVAGGLQTNANELQASHQK